MLGQYYHPNYNFPYFLSSLIAHSKNIANQTHISSILWQKLGSGVQGKSHVEIYVDTMKNIGLDSEYISHAKPNQETAELVQGYVNSAKDEYRGLGALYATETADLAIVSSIGLAITHCTNVKDLPWVEVHVNEEPDHVDNVDKATSQSLSDQAATVVLEEANKMWALWINFFTAIGEQIKIDTPLEYEPV